MRKFFFAAGVVLIAIGCLCGCRSHLEMQKSVLIGDVTMDFVLVEADSFTAVEGEKQLKVTLTQDYYIGKYEVTQAQWQAVTGRNPARFKGANRPVERVNYPDVIAFCEKINRMGIAPQGWKFSLPTEAQWEFAARGGRKSKGYEFSGGNDLNEVAWHGGNSGKTSHEVGTRKPNELGVYDMSGNVWEWCLDWYTNYPGDDMVDPAGPEKGIYRVFRGGGWCNGRKEFRTAYRNGNTVTDRYYALGFRLALIPAE